MGTRGLLGFIWRGKRRGIFCRYDAYFSGLGKGVVNFILSLNEGDREMMMQRLDEVSICHRSSTSETKG